MSSKGKLWNCQVWEDFFLSLCDDVFSSLSHKALAHEGEKKQDYASEHNDVSVNFLSSKRNYLSEKRWADTVSFASWLGSCIHAGRRRDVLAFLSRSFLICSAGGTATLYRLPERMTQPFTGCAHLSYLVQHPANSNVNN